ncbi:unnamed protein product [Echinostoma caproni]|uniref:Uncharacterized protein n=1 Tax=Echinostoma caproni TaxID=27848 RepID=A0A183B231_9TREM|nr:unnamed protein product [Echinostoma caproni]
MSDANTAASGEVSWRRFGVPLETNASYGIRPERWEEPQTVLDDLALYERPSTDPWSRVGYHPVQLNAYGCDTNGRVESETVNQLGNECSPSNPDRESPLFYSLAPIQSTGCPTICPNCRCEANTPIQQHPPPLQAVAHCSCTGYHQSEPISSPTHRFGAYLDQNTPTKLTRTAPVTHTPFPSLVLSRVSSTEHSGSYYDPRDEVVTNTHSVNGDSSDYPGLGSPASSTSGLDFAGDVRAVNLVSHDQLPLRTWI